MEECWSLEDYDRWMREVEEREERQREAHLSRVIERYDPECEAAVRALEETGWGRGCQHGSRGRR